MIGLLELGLSNVLVASVIAMLAAAAGRWLRRPALTHGLWLLVFLKLLTPPLFAIPVGWRTPPPQIVQVNEPAPDSESHRPDIPVRPDRHRPPEPVMVDQANVNVEPEVAGWESPRHDLPEDDVHAPPPGEPVAPGPKPPFAVRLENEGLALPENTLRAAPAEILSWAAAVDWSCLLGAFWLTGAALWFAVAAVRLVRFHRLLRFAAPAPADLQAEAQELAARLGVACPRVWLVPGQLSPMLWFWLTPRLLLPAGLLKRLDAEQRQALLAHELAHWRRGDHWVRRLELLVLGLYWWCPLVWWARHELQQAEEECCDAWVVWLLPGAARSYALALVETADFLSGARAVLPPAASGIGHAQSLRRRLTMIMRDKTPRALTVGGVLAVLAVGALLLPLAPTWAQQPPAEQEEQQPPPQDRNEKDRPDKKDRPEKDRGPDAGPKDGRIPPEKREQLEKARQELRRMHEELERMRDEIERRTRELQAAMQRLQQAEGGDFKDRKPQPGGAPGGAGGIPPGGGFGRPDVPGARPGEAGGFRPGDTPRARPDLERRLEDVERKLDRLLEIMMRKGPPQGGPIFRQPQGDFKDRPVPPPQGGDPNAPPRRPGANTPAPPGRPPAAPPRPDAPPPPRD